MAHMQPAHRANHDAWEAARSAAYDKGYELRRVVSNSRVGRCYGWHRYIAITPGAWASIRSFGCHVFAEAPQERAGLPSIQGEAKALSALERHLLAIV